MPKYFLSLLGLIAFNLFLLPSVFAIENTNTNMYKEMRQGKVLITPNSTPIKQMIEQNRQLLKQDRTDLKATLGAEKEQFNSQALKNLISMLNTRVENAVSRLSKRADLLDTILNKVDQRLTKIETERGIVLTEARGYLTQAKTELVTARLLIADIKIDPSLTTKDGVDVQKATLKSKIDLAYKSLKKVSELLRQSVNKAVAKSLSSTPKVKPTYSIKPMPTVGYKMDE